jgi:hypothetical protein
MTPMTLMRGTHIASGMERLRKVRVTSGIHNMRGRHREVISPSEGVDRGRMGSALQRTDVLFAQRPFEWRGRGWLKRDREDDGPFRPAPCVPVPNECLVVYIGRVAPLSICLVLIGNRFQRSIAVNVRGKDLVHSQISTRLEVQSSKQLTRVFASRE